jgi:hypothetical protein
MDPRKAKTLAGVVAVSIAALLFAGCGGGGSKLSPAQKELCDQLNARKKRLDAQFNENTSLRLETEQSLAANLRERAEAGC